jgi:hypothetical protein
VTAPRATKPTPDSIAAELTVPERLLLLCLASDTDWAKAGVTHITVQHMMVRGLIERDRAATRYGLTEQGRWQCCLRREGDDVTKVRFRGTAENFCSL